MGPHKSIHYKVDKREHAWGGVLSKTEFYARDAPRILRLDFRNLQARTLQRFTEKKNTQKGTTTVR